MTIGSVWNPQDTVIIDRMIRPLKERVVAEERDEAGHFKRLSIAYERPPQSGRQDQSHPFGVIPRRWRVPKPGPPYRQSIKN